MRGIAGDAVGFGQSDHAVVFFPVLTKATGDGHRQVLLRQHVVDVLGGSWLLLPIANPSGEVLHLRHTRLAAVGLGDLEIVASRVFVVWAIGRKWDVIGAWRVRRVGLSLVGVAIAFSKTGTGIGAALAGTAAIAPVFWFTHIVEALLR